MKKALICLLLFILLSYIVSAEACSSKENDAEITDEECRNLEVENENLICIKGTEGCESLTLCEKASSENGEGCPDFPVSSYEYKCEARQNKAEGQSDCQQTLIECEEEIGQKFASSDYCKKLDVDDGFNCLFEKETPKCAKIQINCGEEEASEISESFCNLLKTSSDEYKCIKGTGDHCAQDLITCGEEESGKASDTLCPKLRVEEGFKCVLGSPKCKSEQIECGSESGQASIDYCPKLKVSDPTYQVCVKDETENECIVAKSCADVKIGATDSICNIFKPSSKEICIKENSSCVVKTLCHGAEGASNEICSGFHVSDSTKKKCVKNANEDKCEEIDKSEEEIEEATKTSDEAGQASQEPNKSSSTSSSSSKASQASNDTPTKSSAASNKKTDESDGAKVINISLMLVISLLIL